MARYEVVPQSRTFELVDAESEGDFGDAWTDQAVEDHLAHLPNGIAVATAREDSVPVDLEVADERPEVDEEEWDHVVEAGIEAPSGSLRLLHEGVALDEAPRVDVPTGHLGVLVLYGALGSAMGRATGGEDHYRVVLWPGRIEEPRVVKRWKDN